MDRLFFVQNPKTQFTIFKNPVRQILQKPSYFPKTQFWKWQNSDFQKFSRKISHFFLNISGICKVFAYFDRWMSLMASNFKFYLNKYICISRFCALWLVFKTKFDKFCQNPVVFQKLSSENTKTQFWKRKNPVFQKYQKRDKS